MSCLTCLTCLPYIHALYVCLVCQLFRAALRLLLARLRAVEEATGSEVLRCLDWEKLRRDTKYVPRLWSGAGGLLEEDVKGRDVERETHVGEGMRSGDQGR